MFVPQSDFLRQTIARGFFHQATHLENLDAKMCMGTVNAYLGFDASAKSLHIGNLVQIMRLRLLQRTGHKPIILIGGGTTRVGDPSGKDETRKILNDEEIGENIDSIKKIFSQYLTFGLGSTDALIVNNADWLNSLNYLNFLRDYGKHFSINRMMSFDSVRLRLERQQPLSFLEFNYMILQSYDFFALNQSHQVLLQLGGADQWGNIVSGIDLIRRLNRQEAFGLTSPLITTSSGAKMGKTAQGAVWLNPQQLSSFDLWQFWRNTSDQDVGKFLRMFTDLSLEDIKKLEQLQGQEINAAKKILANEAVSLCHGVQAVEHVVSATNLLFEASNDHSLDQVSLPFVEIEAEILSKELLFSEALKMTQIVKSKSEACRLIRSKGIRINDTVVEDENLILTLKNFDLYPYLKVSIGKKRHILVKLK